ncbi:hypothetical protein ACFPU0_13220 [Pseudomonas sp. GCM10022186]|uniref:hypothetical protein n=1 Tax=Pseudomonas sp. GCM10022186 TaxID=3252650 RepID=UPI003612D350
MSESKEIAKLFGTLAFRVELGGLRQFQALLTRIEKQMESVGQKAKLLEKKLNIRGSASVKEKGEKRVRHSLDREYKLERAAQQAKRETFKAELEAQKLVYAGEKQQAALASAALRDRQAMAVLAAKEHRATQERLKAEGIQLRNAQGVEAAKLRQARLEKLLGQAQSRTYILQQKALTATQKAELVLNQIRERGQRQIEVHQARQAAHAAREQRQQVKAAQQAERHMFATQRHQVWQASQARKQQKASPAVFDMAPMLGRFGIAAAAIGSAVAGLSAVVNRLNTVQERVSGNEQFANTLEQAGGSNPANQKLAKDEFIRIADKYGVSADLEAVKGFRTFVMAQTAGGKMGLQDAIKMFETQQAAFRGAGMNRQEQQRAALQLQQVRAKTKGDAEDVQTFAEAGPLLIEPIKRAWAERNKFKGTAQQLDKAFRESTKEGNLLAVDFEKGLERFVRDNKASITKQSTSIEANAQRLENEKILQQFGLDQSPQLKAAITDRIQAERDLNEAMKPLRESIVKWDTALQSSTAKMLNFYFNPPELDTLKKRVSDAESRFEKVKGFSESHPARVIAERDLQKARQDLIDAKIKSGNVGPSTPVPDYLRIDLPTDEQSNGTNKLMQFIEASKKSFQLPPNVAANLTRVEQPSPLMLQPNTPATQNIDLGGVHVTVNGNADDPAKLAGEIRQAVGAELDWKFRTAFSGLKNWNAEDE